MACPYCRQAVDVPDALAADIVGMLASELDEIAPWLTPPSSATHGSDTGWNVDSDTAVGCVVAAIAAHSGALSLLELVRNESTCDLGVVFGGGETLMHIACAACKPDVVRCEL